MQPLEGHVNVAEDVADVELSSVAGIAALTADEAAHGITDVTDVAPSRYTWPELLERFGVEELSTAQSTRYEFCVVGDADRTSIGWIYYMNSGPTMFHQKATCRRENHKGCQCWVKCSEAAAAGLPPFALLHALTERLADGACSQVEHEKRAYDLKARFGVKPKPK